MGTSNGGCISGTERVDSQGSPIGKELPQPPWTNLSDHVPTFAVLTMSTPPSLRNPLPRTVLLNEDVRSDALRHYRAKIPSRERALNRAIVAEELEGGSTKLAATFLCPFAACTAPKRNRNRSGWTHRIDDRRRDVSLLLAASKNYNSKHLKRRSTAIGSGLKRDLRRNRRK